MEATWKNVMKDRNHMVLPFVLCPTMWSPKMNTAPVLLPHSCHTLKKQIDLHKSKERSFFGSRFVCKHLVTDLTPKPTQQRYHCTPRGIEAHAARCWESEELWKSAAGREPTTPSARIPPSLSSANIKQTLKEVEWTNMSYWSYN